MQASRPHKRFTESIPGILAAVLLGIIWVASMGMLDSKAYTAAPYLAALCLVVLLWLAGILLGCKVVRLRFLSWCALAAGAYFLWRCHTGYSLVESWGETSLIAGCFIFYIAGIYAGQGEKLRGILATICAALSANILWHLFPLFEIPHPFPLRPEHGVCGPAVGYAALFSYKNFAGSFLMTAGTLPLCNLLFRPNRGIGSWFAALLGLLSICISFTLGTRSVYLLLPVLLSGLWLLWLVAVVTETRRCSLFFVGSGLVLLVSVSIALYDFLFGHSITAFIQGTDTHLRGMAWGIICKLAPDAPPYGFGARATQWEIAQYFNDWCTPNMAHNEYLQAWMDYGIIGVCLMGGILVTHFIAGFRQLSSEHIGGARRTKAGMALLYLLGSALFAACDFGWHQAALASAAAFACGILASPYPIPPFRWREIGRNWAAESRPKPAPIRSQGAFGKLLLAAIALGLGGDMGKTCQHLSPAWIASWRYSELAQHPNDNFAARRALLESVQPGYPDSKLMDTYIMLPVSGPIDWEHIESMLKLTLQANPKQVFTGVMLVDILGRQGRFEEAELLMRRMYVGDGPHSTRTTSWGFYYAYNLIRRGQREMYRGNFGTALSMLRHGFAIMRHDSSVPGTAWRRGYKPWEQGATAHFREDVKKAAASDMEMLEKMGVQADSSWQQPMEKGGKPALYLRWAPQD